MQKYQLSNHKNKFSIMYIFQTRLVLYSLVKQIKLYRMNIQIYFLRMEEGVF